MTTLIETPLFEHQSRAVDFILGRKGVGALYMDMGTGKTRTALECFARLRETCPGLRMVVVCPLSLIESAWVEDIEKFSEFSVRNAHADGLGEADIVLLNYEMAIQSKHFAKICGLVQGQMLVVDESSRMKNHKSKTTKLLLAMRGLPKYKVIMSGTPAPNSPQEYWAQMEFLQDWVLHKSFFGFRNSFFHLARNGQVMQLHGQTMTRDLMRDIMRKGWKYEITPENLKKLMKRIDPLIFRARKDDCLDLPDQIDEVRRVELGSEQARVYREMKRDLIAEIRGSFVTAQVALAKLVKLREICSGFAIDAERKTVEIPGCQKDQELLDVLEEAGDQQAIIWCQFHFEIERLSKLLPDSTTLYGDTKDKPESIAMFKAGKAKYLIAHGRSAAHGLTLTNCSLQIFYSLDYSYEIYEQSRARTHRISQNKTCVYVHLLTKNTIEEAIFEVLKRKGKTEEIVDEFLKS